MHFGNFEQPQKRSIVRLLDRPIMASPHLGQIGAGSVGCIAPGSLRSEGSKVGVGEEVMAGR